MNFLNTTVYKGKRSKTKKHLDFRLYTKYLDRTSAHKPSVFKGLSKGKPFVICEIQEILNLKKKPK